LSELAACDALPSTQVSYVWGLRRTALRFTARSYAVGLGAWQPANYTNLTLHTQHNWSRALGAGMCKLWSRGLGAWPSSHTPQLICGQSNIYVIRPARKTEYGKTIRSRTNIAPHSISTPRVNIFKESPAAGLSNRVILKLKACSQCRITSWTS
jgi:hypothetical protein